MEVIESPNVLVGASDLCNNVCENEKNLLYSDSFLLTAYKNNKSFQTGMSMLRFVCFG